MKIIAKIILVTVSVGFLMFGCNSVKKSGRTVLKLRKLTLTKDLTISANNPKVPIDAFNGLAVGPKGIIYAADSRIDKIYFFSRKGRYLGSFGQKGKGPGEFAFLDPKIRIIGDTLYAKDNSMRRIDLFNLKTHNIIRSIMLQNTKVDGTAIGSPRDMFPLPDGNILVSFDLPYFSPPKGKLHKMTLSVIGANGKFVKKDLLQFIVHYPSNQTIVVTRSQNGHISGVYVYPHLTFFPEIKVSADTKGHIFIGDSDSLSLKKYNERGHFTGRVNGNPKLAPMTSALKDSILYKGHGAGKIFREAIKQAGMPTHWPAYQNLFFDNAGRCWVELVSPGKSVQTWWVFGTNDKPKWKFTLPKNIILYAIRNGEAYGIWQKKGHYSRIIRYRVEKMQ